MRHAVEPPSGIADVTTLYPLKRAEAGGIQLGVSTRYNGAQKRRVCTAADDPSLPAFAFVLAGTRWREQIELTPFTCTQSQRRTRLTAAPRPYAKSHEITAPRLRYSKSRRA